MATGTLSELRSLLRDFEKSSRYSFAVVREAGQPGQVTVQDLLPDRVIDASVVESKLLDPGLVPPARQKGFIRDYLDALRSKKDELLTQSSGRPYELRIDALSNAARIESQEAASKWIITLDAEIVYSVLFRQQRGVDPNPALTTSTPLTWECPVATTKVSISDSVVFLKYDDLIKQVGAILDAHKPEVSVFISLQDKSTAPAIGVYTEDEQQRLKASTEIFGLVYEIMASLRTNRPETDMTFGFKMSGERMVKIREAMLKIAQPALEKGCELLTTMRDKMKEIEWGLVAPKEVEEPVATPS